MAIINALSKKTQSDTNPNNSSTNPPNQIKKSKSRTIYPHAHKYYLISFFLEEKEYDGDDMAWIS